MKKLEIILPLCFVVFHGLIYNSFGEVTAARGIDFGPALMTGVEARIPFVPIMVMPYMLAWVYPVFLLVGLVAKDGVGLPAIRRILFAILVLELISYCLWYAFPVKVSLRIDEAGLAEHGWLGILILLNYQNATIWHACPSFHIAGPWFFFRAAQLYGVRFQPALLFLFVAIAVSTVTIRIHYLMDIAVGLALSELVFRLVLRPIEARGVFDRVSSRIVVSAYVALIALLAAAYVCLRAV